MNQWDIPETLRRQMVEIARQFRKAPTIGEAVLGNCSVAADWTG